jgi:hypothetical protein
LHVGTIYELDGTFTFSGLSTDGEGNPDGSLHGDVSFNVTLQTSTPGAAPEPGSLILLGTFGAGALSYGWKRRKATERHS